MPDGDRGFHLGRRIRAVWLFLVCEWGNRGTEEAFWERTKATQAVSELSRLVPQLSGSQAGWGMTGAGAPGHWLRGGGHRGDPWVSRRTGTAWSKLPLPVGNEQPLGGGARRGSSPPTPGLGGALRESRASLFRLPLGHLPAPEADTGVTRRTPSPLCEVRGFVPDPSPGGTSALLLRVSALARSPALLASSLVLGRALPAAFGAPSLHPAFPSPRAFARGPLPKLLGRDTCPPTGCRPTRDGCPSGWRCRGSGRGGRRTRRGREQRPEPDPARERQEAERSIRGGLRGAGCGEAGRMGQTLKERMKPNEAGSTLSPKGWKPLEHVLDGGGAQP